MKREKWIDNAKGFLILHVILVHVSEELTGLWTFRYVFGTIVPAFFILSGYTMKKKKISREFLNDRFSRLIQPYLYTCFAVMIMDLFNCWKLNDDLSAAALTGSVAKDLLLSFMASGSVKTFGAIEIGKAIGAIWFLPALFFTILIFQFFLNQTEDDKLLGLLTSVTALTGYLTARFLFLPFSIQSGMQGSFLLWVGYEIRKYRLPGQIRWYHFVTAQIILLFGFYHGYCGYSLASANLYDLFLSVPVALSGFVLIYLISRADTKGTFLSYLGKISLTVLCTHLFLLNTVSPYFRIFLEGTSLEGNARVWAYIVMHVAAAILCAVIIEQLRKHLSPLHQRTLAYFAGRQDTGRDFPVDIAKGIFIISIIVCYYPVAQSFRRIVFSCSTAAFVAFSGYFYRSSASVSAALKKITLTLLLPYAASAAVILFHQSLHSPHLKETFLRYLLGMSNSKNILTGVPTVGPTGFILLLFVIRLLYTALDKWTGNQLRLTIAVLCVSVLGLTLGKEGWWLPWSTDAAFCLTVFYYIGTLLRKHEILALAKKWNITYFLLTPVWAYMIYRGSMEISARNYGDYGVCILGAVSGIIIVYMLSVYLGANLPLIASLLGIIGKNTLWILIVHELLSEKIHSVAALRFDPKYAPFLICSLAAKTLIGILVGESLSLFRNSFLKRKGISES